MARLIQATADLACANRTAVVACPGLEAPARMFETTGTRARTAAVLRWAAAAIATLSLLGVLDATAYRLWHGLDRGTDGNMRLAVTSALIALVIGGVCAGSSYLLVRSRLAIAAIVLGGVSFLLALALGALLGGHW